MRRKVAAITPLPSLIRSPRTPRLDSGGGDGHFNDASSVDYLLTIAKDDPRTFCALLGKTLPAVVAGDDDNPMTVGVTVDRPPDETREQWHARTARERGLLAPAIVGPTTRAANGRDNDQVLHEPFKAGQPAAVRVKISG